jgi:antitoxin component YwqK of YwqJK toxin-antitoxin module
MINVDGYKDGMWITCYETGEIKVKYFYNNGSYLGGTTYDKNGKDLHYLFHSEGYIQYNYIELEK